MPHTPHNFTLSSRLFVSVQVQSRPLQRREHAYQCDEVIEVDAEVDIFAIKKPVNPIAYGPPIGRLMRIENNILT